jgi:hypothetical protein
VARAAKRRSKSAPPPPAGDVSAPAPASPASAVDQKLVRDAYKKVALGQDLSAREQAALKKHEKQREEQLRRKYYASIPQKHWREMSGRQTKVLNEQAALYGIPFGGPTINLPAVVRALHDFLAKNAQKLARDDDPMMQGSLSPALEEYRGERTKLARLERLEREGQLVPRDQARAALGRIAAILREAGHALERQFGPAALEILSEALDEAEREIASQFDGPPSGERSTGNQEAGDVRPAA